MRTLGAWKELEQQALKHGKLIRREQCRRKSVRRHSRRYNGLCSQNTVP